MQMRIIHTFVSNRLDNCNYCTHSVISKRVVRQLQFIQNASARVLRTRSIYWLRKYTWKKVLIVYKSLNDQVLFYILIMSLL